MKKFMKGCAITALILIVIGFVLAIIAGTTKETVAIREIVDSLTGGRVQLDLTEIENFFAEDGVQYNLGDAMIFEADFEIFEGDVNQDYAQEEVQELEVEIGGCDFEMVESEDDRIHVEVRGLNKFQGYVKNGTLFLRGTINTSLGNHFNGKIVLMVPADFTFKKTDMKMGAGVMNLGNLSADEMDLEVGAGQIVAESIVSDSLELSIGVGEAILEDIQINQLEVEVGMGSFQAKGIVLEEANIECAMGNVEMEMECKQTDYDYNIECGMGNVTIGQNNYSGIANEKFINNGANRKMEVECAAGNIIVEFTE